MEAARPAVQYELVYRADEGCPTRGELAERVGRFTRRAGFTDSRDGTEGTVVVAVTKDASGYRAVIAEDVPNQPVVQRIVPASSCLETVDAAALVIAMLVDPDAGVPDAASPPTPGSDSAPPVLVAPAAAPAPPVTPEPRVTPEPPAAPPSRTKRAHRAAWAFGASTLGGASWATAPVASFDLSTGVDVESTERTLLSPVFFVGFHFAESPDARVGTERASFRLLSGHAETCPVRAFVADGKVRLAPCASLDLGALRGAGVSGQNLRTPNVFFGSGALTARAEVRSGAFSGILEGGGVFPIGRDYFFFNPEQTSSFRIPAAAGTVSVGLRVAFP